jgi:protein phosphatase
MVRLAVSARTDVGVVRSGNEDSFFSSFDSVGGLFIVADGMGGHAAGEVASEMVVRIVASELRAIPMDSWETVKSAMSSSLRHANRLIHERTIVEVEKQGMGTTASVLLVRRSRYVIGQIGDSRIYLLRDGVLTQITKDHSYVQEQVDAGVLTAEQARYHPYSNVITRCVGAGENVEADLYEGDVRQGDLFLVTSDGLTGMVEDTRLQQLLASTAAPDRIVTALISEANGQGGLDNITAIVIRVEALEGDPTKSQGGVHQVGSKSGQNGD